MTMTERTFLPHDLGTRNDPKMVALERDDPRLKAVWWDVLEMLFEQGGKLPTDYGMLAYMLRYPSEEEVRHLVEDFDLFTVDGGYFFSASAQERIERREAAAEQRREAGRASDRSRSRSTEEGTQLERPLNARSTPVQTPVEQLNKSKEIKENQSSAGAGAPTREEDDFLIQHFFFKNFKNPGREAGRCLENYKDQEV